MLQLPSTIVAIVLALASPLTASVQRSAESARTTAPPFEVMDATMESLQKALAEGRVTSVFLVDAYRARIAAYDHAGPKLNSMIRLNPNARKEAAALDAERKAGMVRGPMHGIPIVLKDNFDTKDMITTGGSLALASHRPTKDAFIVQKLRDAGAIIIGKTNLHELAAGITSISSLGGQTLNPYNPDRCPGGSSGGTGAAVAASFAPIGWGSDTCGSIRIPSAYASLFGLRPTQGLFSRDGIIPLSSTQDTPGPLARSATDLAIALDITVGPDPNDSATRVSFGRTLPRFRDSLRADALKGARIGIFRPYFRGADGDIADTVRAAVNAMTKLGAEVLEVNLADFDSLVAGTRLSPYEMRSDLIDYFARTGGSPVKSLREIIDRGLYDSQLEARYKSDDTVAMRGSPAHRAVLAKNLVLRDRIIAFMDSARLDAMAYPSIGQRPVLVGSPQPSSNCALAGSTGLPAISMPAGFTSDGLPTGLELLGRPFSDARLVSFAYAFEQMGPRRRPPPTTPVLVNGRAPGARHIAIAAGPASVALTFDPATSTLSYASRLSGPTAPHVQAVVFRRADGTGPGAPKRVIARIAGPDMPTASGMLRLLGVDLEAFSAGLLSVAVFGNATADPLAEVRIVPR
jgi:Asp-tRNA(Asn)/Glu-tRNA(Gln) amidotransferase A subunit family amidase